MVKIRIFTGVQYTDENGVVKFMNENTTPRSIDNGYIDFVDQKEFELKIKKYGLALGMCIDAYDKEDNIFWSNYQDVEKTFKKDDSDKLELLRKEYKELTGEDAKKSYGIKGLEKEIAKIKEQPKED